MTADQVNRALRQMILTLSRRIAVLESGGSGSSYTDEQAQDAVGNILDDGGDIDFDYDDGTPKITAVVNANAITYDKMQDASGVPCLIGADAGPLREIDIGDGLALDGSPPVLRVTSVPGGGGGGLVLLEQHTAASSSTLDFTSWYSSSYDEYLIEIVGILPATDGANVLMVVSTNGGSTWDTGANYAWWFWTIASHGFSGATANVSQTSIQVAGNIENTTSSSMVHGSIRMFNPGSSSRRKGFQTSILEQATDGNYYSFTGAALYTSTTAINALQFKCNSGNLAEGTIRIYGIAKS